MATWQHLRSSTANKRPTTSLADGRIAINTNTASPGLFFKDSAGTGIVKVGPVHVGTTAPNSVPASGGSTGNYLGEQWLDTSVSPAQMKVWNGSTWVGVVADELPVSKLQDGAARQLIQTDAAGTGVEWTSNVDVPGTLDVTSTATFDSIAQYPLGSAGAPTITFTGDNNTGIYSPGADQVAISTGGSGRLFVDASGNVGVQTSSPTITPGATGIHVHGASAGGARLHLTSADTGTTANDGTEIAVAGNDLYIDQKESASTIFYTNGSERLRITSAGLVGVGVSAPGAQIDVYNSQASGVSEIARLRWNNAGTGGALTYANQSGTVLGQIANVNSGSGAELAFSTYSNSSALGERMRLTSTGLAIGTQSPGYALTVSDGTRAGFIQPSSGLGSVNFGVATNHPMVLVTNDQERARIDASGRLLVGTSSSPTGGQGVNSRLVVQGYVGDANDIGIISIQRGETAGNITSGEYIGRIAFNDSTGNSFAYVEALADANAGSGDFPGRLSFSVTRDGQASPTEAVRINNLGALKASTTGTYNGATNKVHELRNDHNDWLAMFSNTNASPKGVLLSFTGASPNGTGNEYLYCDDSTALRASIRSNGGLANFQANNVNLSDRNTKKDISPAADTWDCIKEWEIVNYRYKDQPDDADLNLGVIAQQVAESCPEVITVFQEATEDQPEKLGVKEQQMYWMAIKALQEAQVRIEALEAEVAALKAQ